MMKQERRARFVIRCEACDLPKNINVSADKMEGTIINIGHLMGRRQRRALNERIDSLRQLSQALKKHEVSAREAAEQWRSLAWLWMPVELWETDGKAPRRRSRLGFTVIARG